MTAPKPLGEYEIWFLTGSQHLYGESVLQQVGEDSRRIAETLEGFLTIGTRLTGAGTATVTCTLGNALGMGHATYVGN